MATIVGAGFLPPHRPALTLAGAVVAAAGGGVVVWSGRALGRSLTPLPQPRADGTLVERGPYRFVRHPMYTGALVLFAGGALVSSLAALIPTGALAVLWYFKSIEEERRLAERFAGYAAYRRRVRGRFLPGL